jgi:hypothetical protein
MSLSPRDWPQLFGIILTFAARWSFIQDDGRPLTEGFASGVHSSGGAESGALQ